MKCTFIKACSHQALEKLFTPSKSHAALRRQLQKFRNKHVVPQSSQHDTNGKFNLNLFKQAGKSSLLGLTIPKSYGGSGMDLTASIMAHQELAWEDPGFALAYLAHSVLVTNHLYHTGTNLQKEKYLLGLCSGELLAAFAMSEPEGGTDILAMKTRAELRKGDYVLNGGKKWITNGAHADLYLIYAYLGTHLRAFLVERTSPGLRRGPVIDKCGMGSANMCELWFENLRVPSENLLGGDLKSASSLRPTMHTFEVERVTLSSIGLGIADRCLEEMTQYASQRKCFGKPITQFGQIQRHIAECYASTQAARVVTYTIGAGLRPETRSRAQSDATKLFVAPVAKHVADCAMQVTGALGYSREMVVERMWRAAKVLEIGGGTTEALHKNIVKDIYRTRNKGA